MKDPTVLYCGTPFELTPHELRFAHLSEPWLPRGATGTPRYSAVISASEDAPLLELSALATLRESKVPDWHAKDWKLAIRERTGARRFAKGEWGLAATNVDRPAVESPVAIETALSLGHYPKVILTIRWFVYKITSSHRGVAAELLGLRLAEPLPVEGIYVTSGNMLKVKQAARVALVDLLSKNAVRAFNIAEYRLRHNARYEPWDQDRRVRYCLEKAFEAAAQQPELEKQPVASNIVGGWLALHDADGVELTPATAPGYRRVQAVGGSFVFPIACGTWPKVCFMSTWTKKEGGECVGYPPSLRPL